MREVSLSTMRMYDDGATVRLRWLDEELGERSVEIRAQDVVLTFRSIIELKDGRRLHPTSPALYGPTPNEITENGGPWYVVGYPEGGDPGRLSTDWISTREVEAITIVGGYWEWPYWAARRRQYGKAVDEISRALDRAIEHGDADLWTKVAELDRELADAQEEDRRENRDEVSRAQEERRRQIQESIREERRQ